MFKTLPKFNESSYVHYITTKTFKNRPYFKDPKCCEILVEELDFYRKKLGFKILGYIIMPDHLHCLIWWDVEEYPKLTISRIMHGIKGSSGYRINKFNLSGRFGFNLSDRFGYPTEPKRHGKIAVSTLGRLFNLSGRFGYPTEPKRHGKIAVSTLGRAPIPGKVWQKGFYDFNIYTEKKFYEKLNYIHDNPGRDDLVQDPRDYKWTSYHFLEFGKGPLAIDKIEV